jgi:hypothetical protein
MRPAQTVAGLAQFDRRGAGTDSERRAANWLATQIEGGGTRTAELEPFWCRPNWALAHAWHVALGLAGSLLSVGSPRVGGALVLAALLSLVVDELTGYSPGRRLTFEHASQNVRASTAAASKHPTTIIVTANYDAGRTGLVYRDAIRNLTATFKRLTANRGPGWLGWLAIALAWLLAVAILRLEGSKGTAIGAVQLVPTVALVLALALLIELASSGYGPAAGDNGSGTAVALALTAALDAAPPRHAQVELLLQGASDGSSLGLRKHLKRTSRNATNTIVIGVAACTNGHPRFYVSDGAFVPLRYLPRLATLAHEAAEGEPELQTTAARSRGTTPALAARQARLPAISIGCRTKDDQVPRSHHPQDTEADALAMDDAVQFGLMLVERIDSYLATRTAANPEPRPV